MFMSRVVLVVFFFMSQVVLVTQETVEKKPSGLSNSETLGNSTQNSRALDSNTQNDETLGISNTNNQNPQNSFSNRPEQQVPAPINQKNRN